MVDPSSRKQTIAIGYIFAASIGMPLLQWMLATYNTVDTIPQANSNNCRWGQR
jgi:cell division protease FtsH